jgi:YHS domain-containing protein
MGSSIVPLLSIIEQLMSETCAMNQTRTRHHRDPVCGSLVSVDDRAPTATHLGLTYWFRTPECRRKFEAEPGRYVAELAHRGFRVWLWRA